MQELPLNVKWVPESNYHLTLKFLGDITRDEIRNLDIHLQALAAARVSFSLSVGGWGMFPGLKRPSVLWVGMGGELNALRRLWTDLEDRLFESGYPRDRRFHPHITLARFRSQDHVSSLVTRLRQTSSYDHIGSFRVTALHLMESRLSPSGPSYHELSNHKVKLASEPAKY